MRLGSCVALELVVGAGLATGIGFAVLNGSAELRAQFGKEAFAESLDESSRGHEPADLILPLDAPARLDIEVTEPGSLFEGVADELLLAPLRTGAIRRVRFNRGGSSISLRIDFEDGSRAAFKPQQTNMQTVPRREVAAYRLNRLLGLRSVAPSIGRRFDRKTLYQHLDGRSRGYLPRLQAEVISRGGSIDGELSWWIPVILPATIGGYSVDSLNGIVTWKRMLSVGKQIPGADRAMAYQISQMVLFDHLINNADRWTGGNVKASADRRTLYFMDNTFSFGLNSTGHERAIIYLKRSQKFSRSMVEHMRALTEDGLRDLFAGQTQPFDHLVSDREVKALLHRRDYSIGYIDDLIEKHGEKAVLVFP